MCFCAGLCANAPLRSVCTCVNVCTGKLLCQERRHHPLLLLFSSRSHTSTPYSPSPLIPPSCLCASLPADIPLCFYSLTPLIPLTLRSSTENFPPLPSVFAFVMSTSNGFRLIKGTQQSLLASHCGGRMKLCTQGSAALIIK